MSASPAALAEADFLEGHRLGLDAQPTLLLHTVHGTDRLGGPVASAGILAHAPDQRVAATAARSLPSALCERKRTHARPDPDRPRRR
jgi:hypothetical protein